MLMAQGAMSAEAGLEERLAWMWRLRGSPPGL